LGESEKQIPLLKHIEVARAALAVQRALLELFGGLAGMEGRDGAGFAATDLDGTLLHYAAVGNVARKSGFKYERVAPEKAKRVAILYKHGGGERSRDTVDKEIERYQGAVVGRNCVWSISGYTSDVDELGAIAWGYLRDDIDSAMADRLARGNAHEAHTQELIRLAIRYFTEA
jgi:hypothetical protein